MAVEPVLSLGNERAKSGMFIPSEPELKIKALALVLDLADESADHIRVIIQRNFQNKSMDAIILRIEQAGRARRVVIGRIIACIRIFRRL